MTKYILQIALETDLDLFPLEDKIRQMFLVEINNGIFKNHVAVKQTQYEKIEDQFYELVGIKNHSGGSFNIFDKTAPLQQVTE